MRCDGNARNSFPTTQGKDPSSRSRRGKRRSSGCWQDSRASSRVKTGMSGNFLSCSKGVRTFWKFQRLGVFCLDMPQRKWASSRLEGRTSWIFSRCGMSSRLSCGERLLLDATGTPGILSRPRREWIPPFELGGGNGAPLDVGGTLVLPLQWSRECCGTS